MYLGSIDVHLHVDERHAGSCLYHRVRSLSLAKSDGIDMDQDPSHACHCRRMQFVVAIEGHAALLTTALQAINELHEDEDFQGDAGQKHILGVVDEIRTNSAAMAKYEKDDVIMHVLKKLRRFQVESPLCMIKCMNVSCSRTGVVWELLLTASCSLSGHL